MHNQTDIIENVSEILGKEKVTDLGKTLKDWISKKEIIRAFKVDKKTDRLLLIVEAESHYGQSETLYKLVRLFPTGSGAWQISLDYSGLTQDEVMGKVLDFCCS